jgi:hypothetical protein
MAPVQNDPEFAKAASSDASHQIRATLKWESSVAIRVLAIFRRAW